MTAKICRLRRLMNEMDKDELQSLLSGFECSRGRDSEYFLKNVAMRHEAENISRTYLALDPDENVILGYFTQAIKCLNVKDLELASYVAKQMNVKDDIAQSYLLGQLARSNYARRGLGEYMIRRALKYFSAGKEMFGCCMVRLDCKDELIDYYRSHDFIHIRKNNERNLNQMVRFV